MVPSDVSVYLVNHVTASHLLLLNGSSSSVCDLALFTLCMSSVFFAYALLKMLTTLLKHTFQNGGQGQEAAKGFRKKHLCFCLCPPSLENDLNNVVGIDDIRDQRHKQGKQSQVAYRLWSQGLFGHYTRSSSEDVSACCYMDPLLLLKIPWHALT